MMYSAGVVSRKGAPRFTTLHHLWKASAPKQRMSSSAGAAGNRLSGRTRFYKEVGIRCLEIPPWEDIKKISSPTSNRDTSDKDSDTIASPISAGVDGTQSATGVHHIPQSKKSLNLEQILTPRFPGKDNDNSNNNNNNNNNNNSNTTSWYGITLDGRKVSTPMGQTLAVPSETLAYMIAAEWDLQTKALQPSNMPLMTLACTALDQAAIHPQFYRDSALQYLPTDTVRIV
jgi:ATP synthase F1 complex assembly factor 2